MAAPVDYNPRYIHCGRSTGNLHPPSQFPWLSTRDSIVAPQPRQEEDHLNRHGMRQGTPYPDQYLHNAISSEHSPPLSKGTLTRSSKGTSLSLMGGMQKVLESGEYSDLTIKCEDRKFQVHKVVVCSQSKVLAAAMKKGFKESELSIIDLSDDGILLVSYLVKFLYTGNYPALVDTSSCVVKDPSMVATDDEQKPRRSRACGFLPDSYFLAQNSFSISPSTRKDINPKEADHPKPSPDYSLHVEMYALSDQYDIPLLGALARAKLEATCLANWNSTSFLEVIPRVYDSTLESNQGLRTVVLDHARQHSTDFMKDELLKASFHSVLAATPDFGKALLNEYMTVWPPLAGGRPGICKVCFCVEDEWHDGSWCKTQAGNVRDGATRDPLSGWFGASGYEG